MSNLKLIKVTVEDIKTFLRAKPGYLKDGSIRLSKRFKKLGKEATPKDCKQAIGELRFKSYYKHENHSNLNILFYDIETSYYVAKVWQPGYKVNVSFDSVVKYGKVICISYSWNDSEEVTCLKWSSDQSDKSMLEEFVQILNRADVVVAHNGDRFDMPWIKTRCLYNDIDILPKYKSIDTLKIAKYKFRFPSNRLDALGEYLGVGRKIQVDYELWDRVVEKNDMSALEEMMDYCNQDVMLLKRVYYKLTKQTLPFIHAGVLNGKSKDTSPYTGSYNYEWLKTTTTAAGTKQHYMKCLDTNRSFIMNDTQFTKYKNKL